MARLPAVTFILVMTLLGPGALAAKPKAVVVGTQTFVQTNDRLITDGNIRDFLMPGETERKWSRHVSISEYYREKEPKLYLAQIAQRTSADFPDTKFRVTEDTTNGDWILDYVAPLVTAYVGNTGNLKPVFNSTAWVVIKARKVKTGIVVFRHEMVFPQNNSPAELAETMTQRRKELTVAVYDAAYDVSK
jgi:hypothetical protein